MVLAGAVLCGEAVAKEPVKCDARAIDKNAEARLVEGARIYNVEVSCKMEFKHCKTGGEYAPPKDYKNTYTLVVKSQTPRDGKKEAEELAKLKMDGEAHKKLIEQCRSIQCKDCTSKKCKCGCGS